MNATIFYIACVVMLAGILACMYVYPRIGERF